MKSLTLSSLVCLLIPAHAGEPTLTTPVPSSGWTLRSASAGASWRTLGSLDYRGSSNSQNYLIPSVIGGSSANPPNVGIEGIIGDRTYDNGFVNLDSTSSSDGDTWFWGYDSPSQVDGNFLSFTGSGTRSTFEQSQNFLGSINRDDDLSAFSPQLDFLISPPTEMNLPFDDILVSFWAFSDGSDHSFSNFSATQTRSDFSTTLTDRYDISSITPLIGAPYSGTASGPGPILGNLPFDRQETETLLGGDNAIFSNSIATSLDLDGYSLAIGPTWRGQIDRNWSWQGSAGLTLNLFQWNGRESETLGYSINGGPQVEINRWENSDSGTDFSLGVYAKGELIRRINDQWFASAYFQAEMAETVEMQIGESEYEFKPRGFALGFSLGHQF